MKTPKRILAGLTAFFATTLAVAQGMTTWPWFTLPGSQSTQAEEVLVKVVIVSRHGVRTPIPPASQLAHWASAPWPDWKQPAGALTPRGAELAKIMGAYYRRYTSEGQATAAAGCPPVYVYADLAERTQGTAKALLDGYAPNCGYNYRSRTDAKIDPLFHPLEAGICRIDPMLAQTRLLERAGGDLNRITRDLKVPFDALQSMLQCCSPQLCTALGRGEKCTLADLPTVMSPLPDGAGLAVMGSLPIASTTAEILLLEYVDNLPMGEVAWGRATLPQLRDTWRLHTEHFDLTQRTPYLARKMGSALMFKVAAAVTSARSLGFGVVDPRSATRSSSPTSGTTPTSGISPACSTCRGFRTAGSGIKTPRPARCCSKCASCRTRSSRSTRATSRNRPSRCAAPRRWSATSCRSALPCACRAAAARSRDFHARSRNLRSRCATPSIGTA